MTDSMPFSYHSDHNNNELPEAEKNVVSQTCIHIGVFDDIPARYETCQFHNSRCDRLIFMNKHLGKYKGIDLLNKLKMSRLVQSGSPITFKKDEDRLLVDFNFTQCS